MSILSDFVDVLLNVLHSIVGFLRFDFVFRFIPFLPRDIYYFALACIWLVVIIAVIRLIPVIGS